MASVQPKTTVKTTDELLAALIAKGLGTSEVALVCGDCGVITRVGEEGPALYECGECGTRFNRDNGMGNGNVCPQCCNKFGEKVADQSCPDCEEGEVEETDVVECNTCQELIAEDEFGQHLLDAHGINPEEAVKGEVEA